MEKTKVEHCHAGKDGDCNWIDCPQTANYQSICPLYKAAVEADPDYEGC